MKSVSLKEIFRWLGPLLGIVLGGVAWRQGMSPAASITLGVAVLTAGWWMTEAVPIAVASLVPIALLPLLGVLDASTVAEKYGNKLILLLLGGFLLSKAMEQSGAHRRLALYMVRICGGGGGRGLILGFMLAAATLSMWISNTATTLMLLPIALAVLEGVRQEKVKVPLLLGIAYAASIGGLGTPIGTPPNLIFMDQYKATTGTEVSFLQWMKYGVPVVVLMVPLMWLWLSRGIASAGKVELPDTGEWRPEEVRTLAVFGVVAAAWITRGTASGGGWSSWLGLPGANDASVAFLGVIAMFLIPSGKKDGSMLLDWEMARDIPWGVILLFSGGMVLAEGFRSSGLSESLAGVLGGIGVLPVVLLIASVAFFMTFLTEVTSNTASTALMMPVLAAAAVATDVEPALLMLPAALSASCAFMLPVATGPNAVIFGSGRFSVAQMAREGLALNLIGVVVVTFCCRILLKS